MVSRKATLMAGQGGLALFAQASGLNLATDFNGGIAMAAAKAMKVATFDAKLRAKVQEALDAGLSPEEIAAAMPDA
jgi:hypothetical protein